MLYLSVINSIDKMPAIVEELNAIAENRSAESNGKTTAEVLNNQQKSDTMAEEKVADETTVEREDNGNEPERENLLHGNTTRNDESAGEQTGRIQSLKKEVGGRSEAEREPK